MADRHSEPKSILSVFDTVLLIVGVVVGAGIFALPAMVAANTGTPGTFAFAWILGGVISLAGALCYAELATAYPHAGGEHHFLRRALGGHASFLFAWARMTVLQTGSIAIQAYIVADYLTRVVPLGPHSASIYAAATVIFVTTVNLAGLRQGRWAQAAFCITTYTGLVMVAIAGLIAPPVEAASAAAVAPAIENPAFGLAMVFVLLTYGGWNEAAYVSAEVKDGRRNMVRALLWGIGAITALYLLINFAYVRGLGVAGMANSGALAADLMERAAGPELAILVSALIAVAALSTMNATTITGARSSFAIGREVPLFRLLGHWDGTANTPRNALLLQGGITLLLVLLGALTRKGFSSLVDYTAPVFWFFFLLVGVSLFVLRWKDPHRERPFRVPLYPLTPLLFCGVCLYMIRSSLAYTGVGAWVGVAVLLAGVPLLLLARARFSVPSKILSKGEQTS